MTESKMAGETSKSRENGIGVWEFGIDCRDWVTGHSQEEAKAFYEKETGVTQEEYEEIQECTDLDALVIADFEDVIGRGPDGKPIYRHYTGREAIRDTERHPGIIASTEH